MLPYIEDKLKKCYIDGCEKKMLYVLEWYGLNQHFENPEVADERAVCDDFTHLIKAARHEGYGGVPDGIVDRATLEIEHPDLIAKVITALELLYPEN